MTAIFTAIFLSENPTSIFRSWGRRSWRPKQLRIRLRWVMRCQDSYHGNIPGRFSWVEIWWNFLWFKKTHEFLAFQKRLQKQRMALMHLLNENLLCYGVLEAHIDMILHFFLHLLAFKSGWFKHVQALPLNWWFLFVLQSKKKQTSHFRGSKFECVLTKWNSKHSCRRSFCLHVWDRTCAAICQHAISQ